MNLLILLLASTHFLVASLKSLRGNPRNSWLSVAGGLSVAYVFIHLFPELQKSAVKFGNRDLVVMFPLKEAIFILMLIGFTAFYGLEKLANASKSHDNRGSFILHMCVFAVYNFIIGSFLAEQRHVSPFFHQIILTVVLIFHFIGNDFSLYNLYREKYRKMGRWTLGIAVLAGYIINYRAIIGEVLLTCALSVIAGAIIFNSVKEELPEAAEAKFAAFLAGTVAGSVLLLMIL